MSNHSLSLITIIPIFALIFFFESLRLFVSEIYFSNLATLSINISLIFILLIFLTIFMPFLFPNKTGGMSIIISSVILIVLRFLLNFSYPAITPRPNFQPALLPVIIISGLIVLFSILVFGRSLPLLIEIQPTNNRLLFAEQLTFIFVLALGVDSFFILLGGSLDLTVQPTLAGLLSNTFLLLIFLVVLFISFPQLKILQYSEQSDQKNINSSKQLSKTPLFALSCSLGIILFFELYILESPFVFASWANSDLNLTVAMYGVMLFLLLFGLGYYDFKKIFMNKKIMFTLNIIILIFLLDIGFFYSYFDLLGYLNVFLLAILAGFAEFALIADFYLVSKQLVGLEWKNIQWIVGLTPIILLLLILYTGFTFAYPVLPVFIEPLFKGLLIPFMLLFGIVLVVCSYNNFREVHS